MRIRRRRPIVFAFLAGFLAIGAAFGGVALGTEPAAAGLTTDWVDSMEPVDHRPVHGTESRDATGRSVPAVAASASADRITGWVTSDRSARAPRSWRLSAPFAQAEDGDEGGGDDSDENGAETHVINITVPSDEVQYTLTAPGLAPSNDVDLVDTDGNDTNQDTIQGDAATGFIGNGNYDAYRFTGPIERVRIESNRIEELSVRIDGESVDPRTLTGEETATPTTEEPTTTETVTTEPTTDGAITTETPTTTGTPTARTTTETVTTSTPSTDAATTAPTADPPTSTPGLGSESGESGFTLVMFVLIGVLSGLLLATSLMYVVRSDR